MNLGYGSTRPRPNRRTEKATLESAGAVLVALGRRTCSYFVSVTLLKRLRRVDKPLNMRAPRATVAIDEVQILIARPEDALCRDQTWADRALRTP